MTGPRVVAHSLQDHLAEQGVYTQIYDSPAGVSLTVSGNSKIWITCTDEAVAVRADGDPGCTVPYEDPELIPAIERFLDRHIPVRPNRALIREQLRQHYADRGAD